MWTKVWTILESPLREMSVVNSSSDATLPGRKMSKLYAPLGSEFSCPDTEMVPLKTTENCQRQAFPLSENALLQILALVRVNAAHLTIEVRPVKDREDGHHGLSGEGNVPPSGRFEASPRRNVHFWANLATVLLLWFGFDARLLAAPEVSADHYITEVWQATEGLPGNNVTSVVQTSDGYLWVATLTGLARFDGVRFDVFDGNTPGLEGRAIRKLFVDQQGGLWVTMTSGLLARYAAGKFTAFHEADGWSMRPALAFAKGSSNDVMIVDSQGDGYRFRDARFTEFATSTARSAGRYESWTLDAAGVEWAVSSERKLHVRRGADWEPFVPMGDASPPTVEAMAAAKENGLWIFGGRSIRLLDRGRWTREIEGSSELAAESVSCAMEDSTGNLWVGTSRSKLFRFGTNGPPLVFSAQSGFPSGHISDICEDREGNVWVGSVGNGLIRLKRSVFRSFGLDEGLPSERVLSLAEDQSGRLMVGTLGGGMFVRESGRFFGPLTPPGIPMSVWALLPGRSGGIWAGAYGEGLLKIHGQKPARWTMRDGLVGRDILSMYEDRSGALWIGTESGLSRFDGQRFANFSTTDGLSGNTVHAITQDEAGDFWFGTTTGLNRFRDGKFTSFFRRNGLPSDQVRALLAGTNGVLWIGTLDGGLSRFRDGGFVNYSVKQGLPDNSISVILDDGLGYLWLGTGRGICRVPHVELDAFARGLRPRIECVTYLQKDGLASFECSSGNPSGISARDGRLWFATTHGVSVVDPRRIRSNLVPPPVVIEEVSIDGKVVSSNRIVDGADGGAALATLQVPAGRRHLEIAYTALSFTSPTQTRFRTQLEGFDQGWRDFGTRRIAYYDGLPPGAYRFRVVAANNDGVWSDSGAAFAFTVLPYYWKTVWFRSGASVGLTGIALLWFRWRILSLERERTGEAIRLQSGALGCAGDGILIADRDGNIVWINPAFTRLTQYEAAEVAGRNVRLLKSGQHPAEFYVAMWKTLLTGEVWHAEIINRRRDGSLSTYDQTTTPVQDPNGKITHFISIYRDITERKWMEKELRDSEDRFRTLSFATLEGILIYDDLEILEVNRAMSGMFGYTQAELIGKSVLELADPAWRASVLEHIRSSSEKPYECAGERKDGTSFDLEVHCRTCPFRGRMARVAAFRDITETKQSQRRIQLLEQHEALDAERSRIARDMHDELGASLTKISLLGETAELEMASEDEAERESARARLQKISALGRSLVASMDEIVWALNPRNDSLEGFANYLCHFAPELLKLAAIPCRLAVPEILPQRTLRAQARHQLYLAVKEALHNVIKHSGATHATLNVETHADSLSITVADDGRGFVVGEGGRSGHGLGNMRQRMMQLDGVCEIVSQPGHGTRITLRVPLPTRGIL